MIEMHVSGIVLEPQSKNPIVVLKDQENRRALLIWVGEPEANAILLGLEKIATPRPMTHDLLKGVLEALQNPLKQVRITAIRENTFYAELELEQDGKSVLVDARPSDAIALALRYELPIMVAEDVVSQSAVPINQDREKEETEEFRRFIENVKPSDFGKLGG
ncbi:MAG: bifunctional nuclease family protein [Bacteroidota bacterium]